MEMVKELDIRPIGNAGNKLRWALFLCPVCNREVEKVKSNGLKQAECGCRGKGANSKVHGMSNTRFYKIWEDMKKRCDNTNCKAYQNYGAKGITYSDKWATFDGFKEDMFESYEEHLTIDRIDPKLNYTIENCQWITLNENAGKDHKGRKQSDEWINKRIKNRISTINERNSRKS